MELRSKVLYRGVGITLSPGQTTEGLEIPEEQKEQMLTDFPDWFEKLGEKVVVVEVPKASSEAGEANDEGEVAVRTRGTRKKP